MYKQNGNSIKDSGYESKLSSFSFDAKRCSLYASTPKKISENSAKEAPAISQQKNVKNKSFSHNKATGYLESNGKNVEGHQVAHHRKASDTNLLLHCKTIAVISLNLIFAVFVVAYKMNLVAMPYTNAESFHEASTYAQEKFSQILDWAQENQLSTRLKPLYFGLAITIFTFFMVYMDSAIPGINPQIPFRTNTKTNYGQPKSSSINLSYLTAFAAGIVVSALMWYEF